MVSSEEQLLPWALTTYKGITSYSELQDPRRVQLYLGEGVWGCTGGLEWAGMVFLFQKEQPPGAKYLPQGDAVGTDTPGPEHLSTH